MSDIRILIVEDEPLIAEDIAAALTQVDFSVTGVAYDANEALLQLFSNTPDLVLLDINLGGGDEGLGVAETIREKYAIPFLFLTSYTDKATVNRAKTTEPAGYLVKPFTEASLYTSIEIAWYNYQQKNASRYPPLDLARINKKLAPSQPLSEREFEVLQRIYEGKTNQQIAYALFISPNTIKKHINNAYLKLDTPTRSAAIARLRSLNK